MSAIKSPFPQFYDTDGGPLNAGFIYLGTSGQNPETNPITVYWDASLTQPAAQPLRTLNGYISRAGTPAGVYAAATEYSITVRNNRSELVFNAPTFNSIADFQADLAAAIHAATLDADPSELDEIPVWDQFTGLLRKITFTFLQSGLGAVLMTVRRALRLSIWAEHYGADPAALPAVNDAAIAAAIAEAKARGGDLVSIGAGSFDISATIIIESKVWLVGRGSAATEIFLSNFSNCDMLNSKDFAALTGTNAELISEGIAYSFGIDKIRFNGNRANQLTGHGIRLFAKRYNIGEDVMVIDAKEIGFYSEAGDKGGQVVPDDMPEGQIHKLLIYMSGKEGFVFRGPHDAIIHKVSVSQAGQDGTYDGVQFDRKVGVYNGICYVTGHIHAYACTGRGIVLRCPVHANILTGESNWQEGVVLETNAANWVGCYYATINTLEAYNNDQADTKGFWNVDIHGQHNTIGKLRISNAKQAKGGLRIDGNGNTVEGGNILGVNAIWNGTGFEPQANYLNVRLNVLNYNVAGDIGFKTQTGAHNRFGITMFECDTGWMHLGVSAYNQFYVNASSAAGATKFTDTDGVDTGTFATTDSFDVKLVYGATFGFSKYAGAPTQILQLTSSLTITHNGFKTPRACDITVNQTMNWTDGVNVRQMWIANITATTFDVVTNIAAPIGGLTFDWKMSM